MFSRLFALVALIALVGCEDNEPQIPAARNWAPLPVANPAPVQQTEVITLPPGVSMQDYLRQEHQKAVEKSRTGGS